MNISKSLIQMLVIFALSACGGGGEAPADTKPKIEGAVLFRLSDGEGIGRVDTETGSTLVYGPLIAELIAAAVDQTAGDISVISASEFPVVESRDTYQLSQGTLTANGETLTVSGLRTIGVDEAGSIYIRNEYGGADFHVAACQSPTSPPTGGVVNYSGTGTVTNRSTYAPELIGSGSGSFDFGANTFSITGSTASSEFSVSGVVNPNSSLFASTNLVLTVNGADYSGRLYGLFCGANAAAVSAIFITSDSATTYAGTITMGR